MLRFANDVIIIDFLPPSRVYFGSLGTSPAIFEDTLKFPKAQPG
jgi:hypothetical protein